MDYFWENKGWEKADKHYQQLVSMPFQREFPFIPTQKGLYLIRGPRQVGKSSWLKTILSHHAKLEAKCFFLSCENVSDHKELAEILKAVRGREVVLLDEVNFVDGWDRAIKHEIDAGHTKLLVITGSHSYDLRRGSDRMPGRFDAGGEFQLLPMGFDEYEKARTQAGWHSGERLKELVSYFKVGGFPLAVAEAGKTSKRPKKAEQTYWRWLAGDVVKLGKHEDYLKEILIQLALTQQTPISLQTLAKKTRIGSHNTVQEYIEILESCFALRTLYAVDLNSGAYRFKKNKKFYFMDPLIYWIALDLSGLPIPKNFEEHAAEMIANEALARKFNRFGYLDAPSGEVDFVSVKKWALEVKWAPYPENLSKLYKSLTVPEKIVWTHQNFLLEYPSLGKG